MSTKQGGDIMIDIINTMLDKGLIGDMLIYENYFPVTEYENTVINENIPLLYMLSKKIEIPENAKDLALLSYVYAVIDYCRKGDYKLSTYVGNRLLHLKNNLSRAIKWSNRYNESVMLSIDNTIFSDDNKTLADTLDGIYDKYGGYYKNSEQELFEIMDDCLIKWCNINPRRAKEFDKLTEIFKFIKILIHNVVKYNITIPEFCKWYYTKININTTYFDKNGDLTHKARSCINLRLKKFGEKLKEVNLEQDFREKLKEVCEYAEVQS